MSKLNESIQEMLDDAKKVYESEGIKTQDEMKAEWLPKILKGKHYKKFVKVWSMPAEVGKKYETKTSDGKETENTAKEGDVLIRNPGGEIYVQPEATLLKRNFATGKEKNGWKEYQAKGEALGVEYTGEDMKFKASWAKI